MGQASRAVKVVKGLVIRKKHLPDHFCRVSGHMAGIANLRKAPAASGIAKPTPADYKTAPRPPL